jgi:hypothetical protein
VELWSSLSQRIAVELQLHPEIETAQEATVLHHFRRNAVVDGRRVADVDLVPRTSTLGRSLAGPIPIARPLKLQ